MRRGRRTAAALVAVLTAACGSTSAPPEAAGTPGVPVEDPEGFDEVGVGVPTDTVVSPAPAPPTPPSSVAPSPDPPDPTASHPVFLTWDGIELRLPSPGTELVGLHQSNHEGARDLDPVAEPAVPVVVMESRERASGLRSAADVVVPPGGELRSPVTGTVKRAGTYTLYCDNLDDFLVVEPDGRPGIEVKLLHIDGVLVGAGDRVEAGVTVVAPRPTPLPFESQVDELSGPDDWPHVHLEVVDTSIPNEPSPNSGSDDC